VVQLVLVTVGHWSRAAGSITANRQVWTRLTFPALTTDRIRVVVNSALASYSRIIEIEAWGNAMSRKFSVTPEMMTYRREAEADSRIVRIRLSGSSTMWIVRPRHPAATRLCDNSSPPDANAVARKEQVVVDDVVKARHARWLLWTGRVGFLTPFVIAWYSQGSAAYASGPTPVLDQNLSSLGAAANRSAR
jgi:hypothetical protein